MSPLWALLAAFLLCAMSQVQVVVVGQAGGGGTSIATSEDGKTFVAVNEPFPGQRGNGVTFANGVWVAVAGGGTAVIATAPDAGTLVFAPVAGSSALFSQAFGVCARGSTFYAVGQGPSPVAFSGTPASLASWTGVAGALMSSANGCAFSAADNLLVVVGTGANWGVWSSDGVTFNGFGNASPFVTAHAVAFGPNAWIAVGAGIVKVARSIDGKVWIPLGDPASFATAGFAVAFGNSRWVIGGNAGSNTLASASTLGAFTLLGSTLFSGVVEGIAWSESLGLFVATGAHLLLSLCTV